MPGWVGAGGETDGREPVLVGEEAGVDGDAVIVVALPGSVLLSPHVELVSFVGPTQ